VDWIVDGSVHRTLKKADTYNETSKQYEFPQTLKVSSPSTVMLPLLCPNSSDQYRLFGLDVSSLVSVHRTLKKADTYNETSKQYEFPQTPARLQMSLWWHRKEHRSTSH
jgi:hypothetical protein